VLTAVLAAFPATAATAATTGTATATTAAATTAAGDVPDIAMVVPGGAGTPTAVRKGQDGFERLWRLLDPAYSRTRPAPADWARGPLPAPRATVVWGLTGVGGWPQTRSAPGGDVAVEREDQVFLAEDGTPWVRSDPAPDVTDDDIRWHRASVADFEAVRRTGLLGTGQPDGPADSGPGGLPWGPAGLVAGAALGVGGTLLARRAAARSRPGDGTPREPRQELIG
jgi:hypothetical protein